MTKAEIRRERRQQEARRQLLDAARSLLAENGAEGLRVSEVTDRAEMAVGSFYIHFPTKDDIVDAVVTEAVTAAAGRILHTTENIEDPAEVMSIGARALVGLCDSDAEVARLLIHLNDAESRFEAMIWDATLAVMERGVASGRFKVDDPALALTIAIAAVLATIRAVIDGRAGEDAARSCAVAVLRSVGISNRDAERIADRPLPAETF